VSNWKYILKMEAAWASETLVYTSRTTWYLNSEDSERNSLHWIFMILVFSDQSPYYALKWATVVSDLFIFLLFMTTF
jgi:hypothetical protein